MPSSYLKAALIAILLVPTIANAQDAQEAQDAPDALEQACANIASPVSADYFGNFATQVHETQTRYCNQTPTEVPDYPASFLSATGHLKLLGATDDTLSDINRDLSGFAAQRRFPQMTVTSGGQIVMNLRPYSVVGDVTDCELRAKALKTNGSCKQALDEFVAIYGQAQAFYSLYKTLVTQGQFKTLDQKWDAFLEHSRSQTLLELFVNGKIYKDSESASFRRPPDGQWILLHPGVVIENVAEAADGDETTESLSLDVIGYNIWNRDEWYIPSGISYTLVYSDRADVQDWGNAISIHFKSKYVLGFSEHDGDVGWYVSIDLLEMLKDKKQTLQSYKSNF
jgi:hypothetical protein